MAKAREGRANKVEIQKGPINLNEQYTNKFCRQPESTMRDIRNNEMRMDKMTLTLHEPKR